MRHQINQDERLDCKREPNEWGQQPAVELFNHVLVQGIEDLKHIQLGSDRGVEAALENDLSAECRPGLSCQWTQDAPSPLEGVHIWPDWICQMARPSVPQKDILWKTTVLIGQSHRIILHNLALHLCQESLCTWLQRDVDIQCDIACRQALGT